MTRNRFCKFIPNEEEVWNRFLASYDQKQGFVGIKSEFENYEMHPDGEKDYDLIVNHVRIAITVDIQESRDFDKYGDLRLDYISAYLPNTKFYTLKDFNRAKRAGNVTVEQWGKIVEPKADYLVVEFRDSNGQLHLPDSHRVYSLSLLHDHLSYWESLKQFKTNTKTQGESWGSAFIPVRRDNPTLRSTEPRSLVEMTTPVQEWNKLRRGGWER